MFVLMAMFMVGTKMQAQEPYAVLTESNTVLTFYYDDQRVARDGMSVRYISSASDQPWYGVNRKITKAVFDASFANCTSITSTAYWLYGCNSLTTIIGIENLKTDNVTSMQAMFSSCSSLTSLDVSHFNTVNVTNMNLMFSGCKSLTSLDLSNFNTANVTDMGLMFFTSRGLTTIYVSDLWSTENVTASGLMFAFCDNLIGGQGTKWIDSKKNDKTYARIDGGADAPGYFTYKAATGVKGLTRNADLQHAPVYNLGGQQLTAPQRGINIIGGKKVVLK